MLFRNLKTGNIVAAADETSIELMRRSAIYETVEIAPAKAENKRRKKTGETDAASPIKAQEK